MANALFPLFTLSEPNMPKFIVLTIPKAKSQYNAFPEFNNFYLEGFRQLGGEIRYLHSNLTLSAEDLNRAFLFYFGYADNQVLWDIYRSAPLLPVVNHLIDHPFDVFIPNPELGEYVPSYFPIAFDPTWIDFIGRHRKHPHNPPYAAAYQPMAGFVHPKAIPLQPASQRKIKILFAGSAVDPEALRQRWRAESSAFTKVIEEVIEHVRPNPSIQLDLFLENMLNPDCAQDTPCIRTIFGYVNEYIRAHHRLELLRTLAKLPLTIYTNQPHLLEQLVGKNSFKIHSPVNFTELLRAISQTKMVLNCRPNTQGMTERVPSTMMSGAVSINDTNGYLQQEFIDGQTAIFYDYRKLEELPDKIAHLLDHSDELEAIATAGQNYVEQHHTVLHRVQKILNGIEEFRSILNAIHQR